MSYGRCNKKASSSTVTGMPHRVTELKFTKLEIKATEADQVPEEEAATEEAEDIAQALKRTYAGTVETHGILDTRQNVKQMDKSATSTTD